MDLDTETIHKSHGTLREEYSWKPQKHIMTVLLITKKELFKN